MNKTLIVAILCASSILNPEVLRHSRRHAGVAGMYRNVVTTSSGPTALVSDNFESGSFSAGWNTTTDCSINTPAYFGVSAPSGGGTNICLAPSGLRYVLSGGAQTEVWIKMQIYSADQAGGTNYRQIVLRQSDQQLMFEASFNSGWGGLHWNWYRGGTGTSGTVGTISNNTWYTVKYHFVISATVGMIQIWVNGTLLQDSQNINTGTTSITDMYFGTSSGTSTNRYIDNVAVYSTNPD